MDNQKVRSVILRKLYEHNNTNPNFPCYLEEFTKLGISKEQISVNVRYLEETGLVKQVLWDATIPIAAIISAKGMDAVENPETFGDQFPFISNNIQIITGDVKNSLIAQTSGDQTINISESFNQIYNQIDKDERINLSAKEELKKDVKELEEHLKDTEKINLGWLKSKLSKISKTGWNSPILQNIILELIKAYLRL